MIDDKRYPHGYEHIRQVDNGNDVSLTWHKKRLLASLTTSSDDYHDMEALRRWRDLLDYVISEYEAVDVK